MKILYHHRIASKDGQYVHVEELTEALKKQGHELIFVAPRQIDSSNFGDDAGFVDVLKKNLPAFIYELLELGYSLYVFVKLFFVILKFKPDFIYERYNLYMPAGIWAKKLFDIPLLLEVNAPLFDERKKFDGIVISWLAKWSERYAWRNADKVLAVTAVLGDIVNKEDISPNKIVIIPNGINPERFEKALDTDIAKLRLGLEGKLVLGFTGFVRKWHRLDVVLSLLINKPSRHLLVVGDGPDRSAILERAHEIKVDNQVTITGVVERNDVASYVSAFDIALQSDVTDYASPLKLFEYMVLGKAIVAPDKENIKEVLTDNIDVIFYKQNNVESLLKSIEVLCEDNKLRKNIGGQAKRTVFNKNHTWESNAQQVCEIAQTLIHIKNN